MFCMGVFTAICKGFARVLGWIVNYKAKYDRRNFRYQQKSLGKKIFTLVEMFLVPILVLAFGLFIIPECYDYPVALIVAIIGYIVLGIQTVEFEIMNSVLGFRNMFVSRLEEYVGNKLNDVLPTGIEIDENVTGIEIKTDETPEEEKMEIKEDDTEKKRCRKIDLLIGIFGIVLTVAFIGLAILVGAKTIAPV